MPITVIVNVPAGVDAEVFIVSVLEQTEFGVQPVGENDADAPVGKPDAERLTACAVPTVFVIVIALVTDPCS